jgi:hypothetical protein
MTIACLLSNTVVAATQRRGVADITVIPAHAGTQTASGSLLPRG